MSDRTGWIADPGHTDDEDYLPSAPWRPYLICDGSVIVPLRMWFTTKAECERFIRDEVLGKPLID